MYEEERNHFMILLGSLRVLWQRTFFLFDDRMVLIRYCLNPKQRREITIWKEWKEKM